MKSCRLTPRRVDVPAILALVADQVEWKFCGPRSLPFTGTFRTREEIGRWFASIPTVEDIQAFAFWGGSEGTVEATRSCWA